MGDLPNLVLVLGGASSGKTAVAERLVLGSGRNPVHIATASALDDEMKLKIEKHRQNRGERWRNLEASRDPEEVFASLKPGDAALFDCATMWLLNALQNGNKPDLVPSLNASCVPVVVVSNEIGSGIVPESRSVRHFRVAHGELNQRLAAAADLVVLVSAGIPMAIKGTLPNWA